jgi:hypothetical protein
MAKSNDPVSDALISAVMAQMGSKGGSAKVTKGFGTLSPAQRAENAKKAAEARWGKKSPKKGKKAKL